MARASAAAMLAARAAIIGSSPAEIGRPTISGPGAFGSLAGGMPVSGRAGSMIRPGIGGSFGSGLMGMAPAIDGVAVGSVYRTVVRRSGALGTP